ncbi:MAG: SMP-30/gluconolactonase/LRE family protein, partial [Vicinamibacterales bacterium]
AAAAGGGGGRAAGPPPGTLADYTVTEIPGVIKAGQKWRVLWTDTGNNADSPIGVADGVLVAQNSKSQVLKVGLNGKVELVATDTYTGGALAMTKDGKLYVGERALDRGIWQIQPERKLFANKKDGEPLECLGQGVLNDMVADSKGGMYMTMGGVYYTNPQGVVMGRFGVTGGNGLILGKDDKTLYVTGRLMGAMPPADLKVPAGAPMPTGGLVAFDVQPDGSLTNERQFTWAGGDGTAIDEAGRIYTTGNGGTWVIGTKGELLGFIPGPRGMISVAFGGPNKKTLFGVSINPVHIFAIDMIAEGIKNRPK